MRERAASFLPFLHFPTRLPVRGTNTVTRRLTLVLSHESGDVAARTRRTSTWRTLSPLHSIDVGESQSCRGYCESRQFPAFLQHFLHFPCHLPSTKKVSCFRGHNFADFMKIQWEGCVLEYTPNMKLECTWNFIELLDVGKSGVFPVTSNGKNATNFFPYLIKYINNIKI